MNQRKQLLVPVMTLILLSPAALWAVEGETDVQEEVTPTFQSAAQAERAANLATASITGDEVAALEEDASSSAEDYANSFAEDYANDLADQHVKDVSRNYANEVVNIDPDLDDQFRREADQIVQDKAEEYARGINEDVNSMEYKEAYEAALSRATDPSFNNLWDTTYKQLIEEELGSESADVTAWQEAYEKAFTRATSGGESWEDARQTAYKEALEQFPDSEEYGGLFDEAYDKALAANLARLTDEKYQDIYDLRFKEKLGWGVITKRLGLPASYNSLARWRKGMPASGANIAPPSVEELPLQEEIEKATRRNVSTGWTDDPQFEAEGKKGKGNMKKYGLAQTSGIAGEDARGNTNKGKGNGKGTAGVGKSGNKDQAGSAASAASATGKNSGNKGKGGNSNKGGKSDRGNNGNKGGNGGGNGNKGGNGKNK